MRSRKTEGGTGLLFCFRFKKKANDICRFKCMLRTGTDHPSPALLKVKTRYSLIIPIQHPGSIQLKIPLTSLLSFKNTLPKTCIKKNIRIVFFWFGRKKKIFLIQNHNCGVPRWILLPYSEDLIFPVPSLGACYPLLIFDELHML